MIFFLKDGALLADLKQSIHRWCELSIMVKGTAINVVFYRSIA
jgi:hypothetical protein